MNTITDLKIEARRLLDKVNYTIERSPIRVEISYSLYDIEDKLFKKRLNELRQKIALLQTSSVSHCRNK